MTPVRGTCAHLPRDHFYYLASPYTLYCSQAGGYGYGWRRAYLDVADTAAALTGVGLFLFSPILQAHALADAGLQPHDNGQYWMGWCAPFMARCDALLIADNMPGWEASSGVLAERRWFRKHNRPVYYVTGREDG